MTTPPPTRKQWIKAMEEKQEAILTAVLNLDKACRAQQKGMDEFETRLNEQKEHAQLLEKHSKEQDVRLRKLESMFEEDRA